MYHTQDFCHSRRFAASFAPQLEAYILKKFAHGYLCVVCIVSFKCSQPKFLLYNVRNKDRQEVEAGYLPVGHFRETVVRVFANFSKMGGISSLDHTYSI